MASTWAGTWLSASLPINSETLPIMAIQQFALQNRREIGERRAELMVGLHAACNGALRVIILRLGR